MAPLCVAGRLPLLPFLCIVCHFYRTVSSLLVYDRLCLLQIRDSVVDPPIQDFYGWTKPPPPVLASVPPYLWRPLSGSHATAVAEERGVE